MNRNQKSLAKALAEEAASEVASKVAIAAIKNLRYTMSILGNLLCATFFVAMTPEAYRWDLLLLVPIFLAGYLLLPVLRWASDRFL